MEWHKIGAFALDGRVTRDHVEVGSVAPFRLIKLRSRGVDVEVFHWALRFDDGTLMDLSLNCLLAGTESRPMPTAGRRLRDVSIEYQARKPTWLGRLEIWAQF